MNIEKEIKKITSKYCHECINDNLKERIKNDVREILIRNNFNINDYVVDVKGFGNYINISVREEPKYFKDYIDEIKILDAYINSLSGDDNILILSYIMPIIYIADYLNRKDFILKTKQNKRFLYIREFDNITLQGKNDFDSDEFNWYERVVII